MQQQLKASLTVSQSASIETVLDWVVRSIPACHTIPRGKPVSAHIQIASSSPSASHDDRDVTVICCIDSSGHRPIFPLPFPQFLVQTTKLGAVNDKRPQIDFGSGSFRLVYFFHSF